jgi:sigma54-dependent transcription regulator
VPWPPGHVPKAKAELEYAEIQAWAMASAGLAESRDEALHMLLDVGEIDADIHARLLSAQERQRVYGSAA